MSHHHDETTQPQVSLAARALDSHKGTYGKVLVVGGSYGMAGAAALAGMAALRAGAGLVQIATAGCVVETVARFEPSYMTVSLPDDGRSLVAEASEKILELVEQSDVVVLGPGLGRSKELNLLVQKMYAEVQRPMVVDADALNALAANGTILSRPGGVRILTPHLGEYQRLITGYTAEAQKQGFKSPFLQDDFSPFQPSTERQGEKSLLSQHTAYDAKRIIQAARLAACDPTGQTVVVLKGHRTVVCEAARYSLNLTGNPGMATGGMGDVLSGLLGALLAEGLGAWEGARLGTYLHGLAGDLGAAELGQRGLIASEMPRYLAAAFNTFSRSC